MYDTEWDQIANKLLDTLDQGGSSRTNPEVICSSSDPQNADTKINALMVEGEPSRSSSCLGRPSVPNNPPDLNYVEQIRKLDPKCNLIIHRYLKYVQEDPIVLEYCEKLIELNFVPCEPHILELKYYTKRVQLLELSEQCRKECILMLVSFFKCAEIRKKLKLAENERCALFEVSALPEFLDCQPLFTIAGHDRFSTLRHCLCIQMQRAASLENQFAMELILIRIYYSLLKDIKQRKNVLDAALDFAKGYFMFLYLLVKYEYERDAKLAKPQVSLTDFDDDNNLPIYPAWRCNKENPPLYFEIQASSKILERSINANLKTFDASNVLKKMSELNQI